MQRVLHPKEPLVLDPADRGVRGQPQRAVRKNIANMVRPARTRRIVASPVARRTQADADSRCASNGPDDPDERNRAVHPFGTAKPGTEIGDFYRSEEHTSELQSLMRISYAVFCLKKKKTI